VLYLKETRSAFLRLWVWKVSPENRVLGPRSMSFKERGGFWRNSRHALEQGMQLLTEVTPEETGSGARPGHRPGPRGLLAEKSPLPRPHP